MEDIQQKPAQRTSYKKKSDNNFKLIRDTMDYYISRSKFNRGMTIAESEDLSIIDRFKIYNNELPESWFNFVLNPLNSDNKQYQNFPARIRKMNILRANIDRIIGEYNKRPFMYGVSNKSEDAYNMYLEQRKKVIQDSVYQNFINEIKSRGVEGDMQQQEVQPPEQMVDDFDNKYQDIIAEKAQKFLNVITEDNNLIEEFTELFKDYVISGYAFSFKEVFDDQLIYEEVSPAEIDYDKSPHVTYVKDAEWVVQRQLWTVSDVADRFYHELKDKDYKQLESNYNTNDVNSFAISLQDNMTGDYVEVVRVAFSSYKKVGIWTYVDPVTGELQEDEVDEDFKVPEHMKDLSHVEWQWRTQYWLGYRVNGDLYFDMRPVSFNPFNGRAFSDKHSENLSLTQIGAPYLVLYIILNYRLELTIAKSKGKIALIDQNTIPKDENWDEDKFVYYAESLGWGILNRDQIGVDKSWNQYTVLDMSLYNNITQLIEVIEYVKNQWDEVVGMNEYRKGQMASTAGKGQTERGVFQGSIVSDMIFFTFENFIKQEYQSILDLSKYMSTDGIRRIFLNSDWKSEMLEILPEDFVHADLGIFVTNSSVEQDRIRELKNYAQQSLANGGKLSTVAEIVSSDSMAQIKRLVNKAERIEMENVRAMEQDKAKQQEQIEAIKKEYEQFKQLLETQHMHQEYDRKEDIEHIKGQYNQLSFTQTLDANQNQVPDSMEIAKNQHEIIKERNNTLTKLTEMRNQKELKEKELRLKNKEIESREKIEKRKAEVALKNKVVGEE